jgi:hypothetical protein
MVKSTGKTLPADAAILLQAEARRKLCLAEKSVQGCRKQEAGHKGSCGQEILASPLLENIRALIFQSALPGGTTRRGTRYL